MNPRETSIEARLRLTGTQWKLQRLLAGTFMLVNLACLIALLLGISMVRGWLNQTSTVILLGTLTGVLCLIGWLLVAVRVVIKSPDQRSVAGAIEQSDQRLMDRLNTIIHLQKQPQNEPSRRFYARIAQQTRQLLGTGPTQVLITNSQAVIQLAILAVLLTTTLAFYEHYSPWKKLLAAADARRAEAQAEKPFPEINLPTNNLAEESKTWGEVRITDPAHDLKVTKVDVVPLQIEAAANQALQKVAWYSTVNGGAETNHDLPPPPEPKFAVYQPTLYLDEYHLSDWDVLTYYANAKTKPGENYGSQMYFVEIRPFREDILKLPGGEGGAAYDALSEMTGLIERQQHVIRETHRYQQSPAPEVRLREQDRRKLWEAEDDLSESTRHLYAEMATKMENKPIGEALDHLAQADKILGTAARSIETDNVPQGQNQERSALTELIASRKMFQKAVSDHPGDFQDKQDQPGQESSPVADSTSKLNEIAEFRNEARVTQDFVKEKLDQQSELNRKSAAASRNKKSALAENERNLKQELEEFRQQHPRGFQEVTNEVESALSAIDKAADSLQKNANDSRAKADQAASSLQALDAAMRSKTAGHELADAYKLKQMLDQQIQKLDSIQNSTNPPAPAELQKLANDSRQTVDQLREVAENHPTSEAFGPQLKQSLTGTNQDSLASELKQLAEAPSGASAKQAAGEVRSGLARVSQAFNDSQPSAMQSARQHDSLKQDQREAFEKGMEELESLKQQMEKGHALSDSQEAKLRKEALANLTQGLSELSGNTQSTKDLLLLLDEELKDRPNKLDLALLKKLMDQLRNFSIEVADKNEKKEKPELTNVDASKLPPAYRGRIEKYYQKLSEQKP